MARRKNVKRIDPRYFLHETVDRDINTAAALEEERQAPVTHWIAGPDGLTDQHGDVFVKHGTAFAATRKPSAGQGMMVIGVGHGTGTERWFGERPVPYEDVQKHRSNPNYNPPQPGPDSRTSRNSPVVQEEDIPPEPNWRGNSASQDTARKAKRTAAKAPAEEEPAPSSYSGDPYALDHEQAGQASLDRWRSGARRSGYLEE